MALSGVLPARDEGDAGPANWRMSITCCAQSRRLTQCQGRRYEPIIAIMESHSIKITDSFFLALMKAYPAVWKNNP